MRVGRFRTLRATMTERINGCPGGQERRAGKIYCITLNIA